MEKSPVYKSLTKVLELTSIEQLTEYVTYLQNVANNPHKYSLIDNTIKADMFGNPFIVIQLKDNVDEEEKQKKEFSLFGQIISQVHLDDYDKLTDDHWDNKIKLTYIQDFYVKDKENPMYYKLVIYYKVNEANILKSDQVKLLMPRSI